MTVSRRSLLKAGAGIAAAGVASSILQPSIANAADPRVADIVVVGCGSAGLGAAVAAAEAGASVIVLEAQPHIGGRGIVSSGNIPLGGGTPAQMAAGIADSPDLLYRDLTDWSIVQANGFPSYRYNDRELIRAFADVNVDLYNFLVRHGVVWTTSRPDNVGGNEVGNSVNRMMHTAIMNYVSVRTGLPVAASQQRTTSQGPGFIYPLEAAAKARGVKILLNYRLESLLRTKAGVVGVVASNQGRLVNIQARKGVVIASGGGNGNVEYRRQFDPRLTAEYCGVAGEPYSFQDASGILAGLNVGASLAGTYNQTGEFGTNITKPTAIGTRYNYSFLQWGPNSPVFHLAKASGLANVNNQNVIHVNMIGRRFYDETGGQFGTNSAGSVNPYTQGSYLNAKNITYNPQNWINAALAGIGDGHNGGGPIWAIFDADAVARQRWNVAPPFVDPDGFFFQANTLEELAQKIVMPHQRVPMPASNLVETVTRYNSFVDAGADADFGKPTPQYKIQRGPFYAAWSTPVIHDARSGLRINGSSQVLDYASQVIPGLYAAGEAAGGFSQHGNGRALSQGIIAGRHAASSSY
ncbi:MULTISPECIES: FAD-dependent oxidoreductase [unclassified Mesorhizobium]|uniref:FAD-dependent oxidoreductase n=1 Tax=unclassified Mesorhizobium TaxID=325217 RepID=UPI00112768DD|nr:MULTISPECIES: FAD-dependent oxidoreductase [unclassified Mesorhizobium]TPJ38787.1 FAD-dependent oxidoreductase [Mesorhizobium sp. B2-6-6]MBZ9897601.1 FAD-dependent oxidoreductase [Mesorhizobium sp. BR1-1-6]MBZ9947928.1 FAD-dependent oxidoreductase [Mesorhizobium sp. BR1-1-11]MCA0000765.1 FAD-dependent oxidoreductase [Mesorhizobium sp. B264B2A]MCA0007246.1 FAD-dependent oxidoreductase [Mesorhizobium sp. B264B1B]